MKLCCCWWLSGDAAVDVDMGQHSHNNIMNNNNNLTNNTDTSTKQSKHVKTSNSKNNGYRAKELAEIKNGLQPFEKAEALRTVSSLSTESSTNSVSSDGLTGGSGVVTDPAFSSVQDTLLKLNSLGYDEVRLLCNFDICVTKWECYQWVAFLWHD